MSSLDQDIEKLQRKLVAGKNEEHGFDKYMTAKYYSKFDLILRKLNSIAVPRASNYFFNSTGYSLRLTQPIGKSCLNEAETCLD